MLTDKKIGMYQIVVFSKTLTKIVVIQKVTCILLITTSLMFTATSSVTLGLFISKKQLPFLKGQA